MTRQPEWLLRAAVGIELIGEGQMQGSGNGVTASALQGVLWRKSHYSNPSGNCVELAELPDGSVAVRNSRYPSGPALIYTQAEMAAFLRGAKGGDFDDLFDRG